VAKFGHIYEAKDLNPFLEATHSPGAIAAELANPERLYRLAEIDGRLVGYCKLGLDCSWPEHARAGHTIELKQLYADPALTGQGIGASLMEWALGKARRLGVGEIQLSVWSENLGAQRFYARYGFEKLADIEYWVGEHRDDEFLFALRL
jgi:ribosomal protein S18 acetylase RimI-like enzyme